jgi:hypothetical protein
MPGFVEFAKNSIWAMIRFFGLGGLMLQVHPKSYLRNRGWFHSFSAKRSVDRKGVPTPWWSYGVIDFVEERLAKTMSVLEFGAGGSTVWLAARVSEVVTVENDSKWSLIVKSFIPDNVVLIELPIPGQLVASDIPSPASDNFQLLIVDALANRIDCAKAGLPFLAEDGVVLWDNTDGPDWPEIKGLMATRGFKEISFSGISPQEVSLSRTTIFYKSNNVFGI